MTYHDIVIGRGCYALVHLESKPPGGSAVATLKKIQLVLDRKLQAKNDGSEYSQWAEWKQRDALVEIAKEVRERYTQKVYRGVCRFWRSTGKHRVVETLTTQILRQNDQNRLIPALPNGVIAKILDHASLSTIFAVQNTNYHGSQFSSYAILHFAKRYGFTGRTIEGAKAYLLQVLECLDDPRNRPIVRSVLGGNNCLQSLKLEGPMRQIEALDALLEKREKVLSLFDHEDDFAPNDTFLRLVAHAFPGRRDMIKGLGTRGLGRARRKGDFERLKLLGQLGAEGVVLMICNVMSSLRTRSRDIAFSVSKPILMHSLLGTLSSERKQQIIPVMLDAALVQESLTPLVILLEHLDDPAAAFRAIDPAHVLQFLEKRAGRIDSDIPSLLLTILQVMGVNISTFLDHMEESGRGCWLSEVGIIDRIERRWTPLTLVCSRGCLHLAQLLVASQASIAYRNRNGWTPLTCAAISGNRDLISYLLACGADVNAVGGAGYTPLMCASEVAHAGVVQQLLEAGADPTPTNGVGKTAFDLTTDPKCQSLLTRF